MKGTREFQSKEQNARKRLESLKTRSIPSAQNQLESFRTKSKPLERDWNSIESKEQTARERLKQFRGRS